MATKPFPDLRWIRKALYQNAWGRISRKNRVIAAYVIGSEARGRARPDSDLDIAIVIPAKRRIKAVDFTANYHGKFASDRRKPDWRGRRVDFQFFYPDDAALAGYCKIPL